MPEVQASAPGRVNLIGEHTDYHDGFVMPCAIPQRATATLNPRPDRKVRASSVQMSPSVVEFQLGQEQRTGDWGDYIRGLTWALGASGVELGGFDLRVDSRVPVGSGLSSSAALLVAGLRVLRAAFVPLSDIEVARIAQRAEVEFVGVPVGIMDHMAAAMGREREALFLDTRTFELERIPLPMPLELVIIDSGVEHRHVTGDYRRRRQESEEAARMLGVARLRDAGVEALPCLANLPPLFAKRARHVITENRRVIEARSALQTHDLARLGGLINASHASLRDDYEVSIPAVDLLVSIATSDPDVFGARLTGGGFGGAVVIAVASPTGARVAAQVSAAYARASGKTPTILLPEPA